MAVRYYDTETMGVDTAGIGKLWKRFKRIARRGLKIVSPLLSVVKGIAPMVPGIGTALGAGLSSAEALASGKSLKDAALAGALGAVPGGALAQRAARIGAGAILKGKKRRAIHAYRKALPNRTRAAFDTGACEAAESLMRRGILPAVTPVVRRSGRDRLGTGPSAQAVRAIRKSPGLSVMQVAQKAGMPAGQIAAAMSASKPRRARQTMLDGRTQAFVAKYAGHLFRRGTGGLDASGRVWMVETGDTGEKIAQAVVGAKARWRELLGVNPEIAKRPASKKYGFAIYPGDKVQLPAAWTAAKEARAMPVTVAQAPAASAILASLPGILQTPQTWSDIPQPTAPSAPTAQAPDPGVLQSRAELVAWAKTDGNDVAPFPDYGTDPAESGAQWTERDRLTAQTFVILWNKSQGADTPTDGNYGERLAAALDTWAVLKATTPTAPITGTPVSPGILASTTTETRPVSVPPISEAPPVTEPPRGARPTRETPNPVSTQQPVAADNTNLYIGAGAVLAAVLLLPSLK